MDVQDYIAQAQELGYEVGIAFEGYGGSPEEGGVPTVYTISGFGMNSQLPINDEEGWKSLVDKEAHAERERQFNMTPEERLAEMAAPAEQSNG